MSDLTREDIQDLRERLDDFDRKITDLYQLVAEILGSQMQQESKTKFFKIFFDKDNM
jgi:tetrahydromethanopterin S-methyltransferase subunit G